MGKDLKALIRLRAWQVDEQRRKLAEFLRAIADLEGRVERLARELEAEQQIAAGSPAEAGFLYGPYAQAVIGRRADLARAIAEAETALAKAREDLRDAYREHKKFEITQANRERRDVAELDRLERLVLDEVGLQGFRQKRG